mgnify:CR=1 FL=1
MIRAVKGTRDLLPPATVVWNHVEAVARELFRAYNYQEIRTPILEETQLFARSVGEDTDIVMKEMYTFTDRDGSLLTLRPECTASVIRAYLEHRMDQWPGLKKLYYVGPMFRRERPQKGRFRQFYQIGAECIGSEAPGVDAEVIEMVVHFLQELGLEGFELLLNSVGCRQCRPPFLSHLREQLRTAAPRLCEDCQRRAETNPLRVLDCKVPEDQPIIHGLPSILDHLCDACREHFDSVKHSLEQRGAGYRIVPRLVRGLDYYTRTTFEIVHGALGAQNSVLGGGRYDGLAEDLGAKTAAPGIGFSIGQDRLVMILEEASPEAFRHVLDLFVAPLGDSAAAEAVRLARELRRRGVCVEVAGAGRLKRLMELSNRLGSRFTLILGENEIATGTYSLKNMISGEQEPVTREQLIQRFSTH